MTNTSLRTVRAASCIAWTRAADSSSVSAVFAPIEPFVVRPRCATSTSAPALAIARALSASKTYGQVSMSSVCASWIIATSRS